MDRAQLTDAVMACWLTEPSDVDTPIDNPPAPFPWPDADHSPGQPVPVTDELLLAQVAAADEVLASEQAHRLALLAEAERNGAAQRVHGMPLASWLAAGTRHSARTARADVQVAGLIRALPAVADALAAGAISLEQAGVIAHGLARVDDLDAVRRHEVAAHLVELAGQFDPTALRRLVNHAVAVVAPEVVEAHDRAALDRAEQRQARARYLSWKRDHDGGLLLSGKVDAVVGELLKGHLTALAGAQRAADAANDVATSRGQALADALALVVGHHATCTGGPVRGGDATRVVVTLAHGQLLDGVGAATLVGSDQVITPGQARHLACCACIVPMVLGTDSQPLDVGREHRLFSPAQRVALAQRDGGCAFPGCDRPPADCEAHHIVPWWADGASDLANGVLLCPHHHRLVEPSPHRPPEANWRIDLDARGRPAFTGPAGRNGQRITRQHARYRR